MRRTCRRVQAVPVKTVEKMLDIQIPLFCFY